MEVTVRRVPRRGRRIVFLRMNIPILDPIYSPISLWEGKMGLYRLLAGRITARESYPHALL